MDTIDRSSKDASIPSVGELLHREERSELSSKEPTWKDVSNQVIACCVCALTVVQVGLNMSYSAVLLPQLEDPKSGYTLSKDEASWIASLLVLSTPIGSLLSGPISDSVGRKKGNMLTCIPVCIAWSIFCFCPENNRFALYIARILAGLGGGLTTVFIVYVSEICHEKYRPMLLGLNSTAVSLGVLIVSACGVYMQWKTMAAFYALISFITFVLIWLFVPESPHWCMILSKKSNSRTIAKEALKWLNPSPEIFEKKLQQILVASRKTEEARLNQKEGKNIVKKLKKTLSSFLLRETLLPVLILMGLITFQQLSGGYTIIFYTIHIFKKLGGKFGNGIDEYDALQFMGIIRFIMSVVSAGLSRAVGRRPLLFISSFGMAVSCFFVTAYFHYYNITTISNSEESDQMMSGHWFPMVCILAFVCMSAVGLLNIPWTMMGELLPTSTRGVGTGFLISFAYVVMFVAVKIYPFLLDSISIGNLFLVQGIICLVTILFAFIFIPETLGKNLNEIEKHFSRKD